MLTLVVVVISGVIGLITFDAIRERLMKRLENEFQHEITPRAFKTPRYYVGGVAVVTAYDAFRAVSIIDDWV